MEPTRKRTSTVPAAHPRPQAKIIQFTPRPTPDPCVIKHRSAEIDTKKTVIVEAWMLDAIQSHHKHIGDFLFLLNKYSEVAK